MHRLVCLPCWDSAELAEARRHEFSLDPDDAMELGRSAVEICLAGQYRSPAGSVVDLRPALKQAASRVVSIRPGTRLPPINRRVVPETSVRVWNETTLAAAEDLIQRGRRPLALNFANGVQPGGGFLGGARAQEETLCRSSGLFLTLNGDPMYAAHLQRELPDSTEWAIFSPDVPVFRSSAGRLLEKPWKLCFLTCAAPYAPTVGQPRSGDLLQARIGRVLAIGRAFGFDSLVLGAWGCGVFANDPGRTARDFRTALETDFAGVFEEVLFAIADWSPERRFLGPFRDVFDERTNRPPDL